MGGNKGWREYYNYHRLSIIDIIYSIEETSDILKSTHVKSTKEGYQSNMPVLHPDCVYLSFLFGTLIWNIHLKVLQTDSRGKH